MVRYRMATRLLIAIILIVLTSCNKQKVELLEHGTLSSSIESSAIEHSANTPSLSSSETNINGQEESALKSDVPTKENYIEILESLKNAFATGEYQMFLDQYPCPYIEGLGGIGPEANEWAPLLTGVTADMSYDPEQFSLNNNSLQCRVTFSLNVVNGNKYLPNGHQTIRLHLGYGGIESKKTALYIYNMMLNTDGQQEFNSGNVRNPNPSLEEQVYCITEIMAKYADTSLARTIRFLDVFEGDSTSQYYDGAHTEEQIIAGAKKYLGLDYSPARAILWFDDSKDRQHREIVEFRNGKYNIVGMGLPPIVRSLLILDAPSQGDLTCRVFTYKDGFLLAVAYIEDYNFLVLHEEDNTPYIQLLNVETVELDTHNNG